VVDWEMSLIPMLTKGLDGLQAAHRAPAVMHAAARQYARS
jgi:hypothetical protein